MKTKAAFLKRILFLLSAMMVMAGVCVQAQDNTDQDGLDQKVQAFLNSKKYEWRDMNVPASDGRLLYDIILKNGYTQGLEIGTSTGHSSIWIAWALSKTGGKLTTIEIDENLHQEALANFKAAGLLEYIDARLGDAHKMVKELQGPFDFVFSDADKNWYVNYFKDVSPKLAIGGCFTAHNVRPAGQGRGISGTRTYLEYVQGLTNYTTTVDNTGGGLAISYKKE